MGVLSTNRRRLSCGLAGLLLAVAGGCALLQSLGLIDEPRAFSHERHLAEGLGCTDCHAAYEGDDQPQAVPQALCATCHEGLDEGRPPEEQVASLFPVGTYAPLHAPASAPDLIFSHSRHMELGTECTQCHVGVDFSESTADGLLPSMGDCQDCHAALNVPAECSTCHTLSRTDREPATHGEEWRLRHGLVARAGSEATADDCAMCHTQSSCDDCHSEERPRSHTGLFRLRTHGILAATDRDSCVACHRNDSCESCHEETEPLGHTGAFSGTLSTHCLGCHFPLSSEAGCVACHKGTPSHDLATPQPADHVPGMNCLQCHGNGAPLPHVDKGDNCNFCHQ